MATLTTTLDDTFQHVRKFLCRVFAFEIRGAAPAQELICENYAG